MNEEQIRSKLDSMKKTRRILSKVTLAAAIAAIIMLVAYNFMPVANLTVNTAGNTFEGRGFDFPGWQLLYYGIGRQFIPDRNYFDPNPITIAALFLPLIALIVCSATYSHTRNKGKAIKEFICAGTLIYGGIVLGRITTFAYFASTTKADNFRATYLDVAESSFTDLTFAKVTMIVLLLAAVIKLINGAFLLYQKSFAQKNIKKTAEEEK